MTERQMDELDAMLYKLTKAMLMAGALANSKLYHPNDKAEEARIVANACLDKLNGK